MSEDPLPPSKGIDTPHKSGPTRFGWLRRGTERRITLFVFALLLVEFLDELVFGAREASWPLIRDDLGLNYAQVGLLLGVPDFVANVVEPFIGILGDVWKRRVLVLGGGVVFGLALLLIAGAASFPVLLLASVIIYPASGSFVSLSQATLMDAEPARHEQNMARWTFAGSLGVVLSSLAVSVLTGLNVGWRPLFVALAVLTVVVLAVMWRVRFPRSTPEERPPGLWAGIKAAGLALRRREVLRWLTLLRFADFMLDILLGFLALYFVDVVHVSEQEAALAVLVWTVVGLLGDFLLIPLLERVQGLVYLRISAALELVLFTLFLILPDVWTKFALLALLGLFNAGWYSILQGKLYTSMPGQSGTVMSVTSVFGLAAGFVPVLFGVIAQTYGLGVTMWFLMLGPVALLAGLPRISPDDAGVESGAE